MLSIFLCLQVFLYFSINNQGSKYNQKNLVNPRETLQQNNDNDMVMPSLFHCSLTHPTADDAVGCLGLGCAVLWTSSQSGVLFTCTRRFLPGAVLKTNFSLHIFLHSLASRVIETFVHWSATIFPVDKTWKDE